jgi:hypothetical protein
MGVVVWLTQQYPPSIIKKPVFIFEPKIKMMCNRTGCERLHCRRFCGFVSPPAVLAPPPAGREG